MGRLENSTLILILAEKICKAHALLLLFFLSPKTPAPFVISSIKNAPLFVTSPLPSPPLPIEIRSEMRPPQTPIPPWGSKSRWYMTPTPLSPSFSRHPFQGTAAAASEQPCVRTPFARSSTRVACYPPSFFNPVPPFLLRF